MIIPWKKIKQEPIYSGYRKLSRYYFEGPEGQELIFEIKNESDSVCVLALTAKQEVVLAKQFRPGPQKVLLEMPGGAVNNNEQPGQAIERELLEETGYSGNFRQVATHLEDAYSDKYGYVYVAENCHKVAEPVSEPGEWTETVLCSVEEFRQLLRSGELTDVAAGYQALDALHLL